MTKIIPGEKYRDRSGNLYQVLCTALSLENERNVVIVQQLFGDFLRMSLPQDRFDSIFTNVDVMVTRPPEREKAIESAEKALVEKVQSEAPASEKPAACEDNTDPQMSDMLAFLDTDDFEEKFRIAKRMAEQSEIDDTVLDNMAASLDFIIDDGPLDRRIDELLHCIGTRKRFETTRLRGD
ncbi:MAG: hypothetical protein PUG68_00830 [Lachnospiraceae bacterium]|nr:DUF1653 domain-containing protein [Lachnospiraceae bacterium]MDD7326336.1 hypothetical protein [Lachnospiraceae bacterium]MDY2759795.1 hypothetical protein [Lachnospiraceae bacterium]